eukprot:1161464-Pelagomonas_calceolata.AAC.11
MKPKLPVPPPLSFCVKALLEREVGRGYMNTFECQKQALGVAASNREKASSASPSPHSLLWTCLNPEHKEKKSLRQPRGRVH